MQKYFRSVVEDFGSLDISLETDEKTRYEKAKAALDAATRDVETYCGHFGLHFKNRYGWAADILGKKEPDFVTLEKEVSQGSKIPYKSANFSIHGGPRAAMYRRGLPHPEYVLMGPSRYGLKDVIQNTAISLEKLTMVLLEQCNLSSPFFRHIALLRDD